MKQAQFAGMILGALAASTVGLGSSAHAETLKATWTEICDSECVTQGGPFDFTFDINSNPTPIASIAGEGTEVPVWNCFFSSGGGPSTTCGVSAVTFFNGSPCNPLVQLLYAPPGLGACAVQATFTLFAAGSGPALSGSQLYSGAESAPTFSPGAYSGYDFTVDNASGTFTFAVVPEPAVWALMLAGFAGLGAALRSRRISSILA